jgi:hypothetical protein
VLKFTPELHELCEEFFVKLSLELGSFETLVVAPAPSPPQKTASEINGEVLGHIALRLFLIKSFVICLLV